VGYQLEYRKTTDSSTVVVNTVAPAYLITGATFGTYQVRVRAIDTNGNYSGWLFDIITLDLTTYFASSTLPSTTYTAIASTLSDTPLIDTQAACRSTEYIFPQPQGTFGSSESIVIIN
jgi:hypothetical protein